MSILGVSRSAGHIPREKTAFRRRGEGSTGHREPGERYSTPMNVIYACPLETKNVTTPEQGLRQYHYSNQCVRFTQRDMLDWNQVSKDLVVSSLRLDLSSQVDLAYTCDPGKKAVPNEAPPGRRNRDHSGRVYAWFCRNCASCKGPKAETGDIMEGTCPSGQPA